MTKRPGPNKDERNRPNNQASSPLLRNFPSKSHDHDWGVTWHLLLLCFFLFSIWTLFVFLGLPIPFPQLADRSCETWVMVGRVNGSPCFQTKIRHKMLGFEGAILMVSTGNVRRFRHWALVTWSLRRFALIQLQSRPCRTTGSVLVGLGDTYHDYVTLSAASND